MGEEVIEQMTQFFAERGLTPMIPVYRRKIDDRAIHAQLNAGRQFCSDARRSMLRQATVSELATHRPCRKCLKSYRESMMRGYLPEDHVMRARRRTVLWLLWQYP